VHTTYVAKKYAEVYLDQIVRLHGIPKTIISDRGAPFIACFWEQLQSTLGTKLIQSSAYHPQKDGQTERVNQILEDMLRACIIHYGTNWDKCLALAEFSYNNSYQSSLQMSPFEALYGRRCRTPLNWSETGERKIFGPDLVVEAKDKVRIIQANLKTAQSRQKSYADRRRKPLQFQIGDFGPVAYKLRLPSQMAAIHDVFHISQLKKCIKVPTEIIETPAIEIEPDLSYVEQPIQILDTKERVTRRKTIKMYKILWDHHTEEEATWETESYLQQNFPTFLPTNPQI
jgi:hypothetical protein